MNKHCWYYWYSCFNLSSHRWLRFCLKGILFMRISQEQTEKDYWALSIPRTIRFEVSKNLAADWNSIFWLTANWLENKTRSIDLFSTFNNQLTSEKVDPSRNGWMERNFRPLFWFPVYPKLYSGKFPFHRFLIRNLRNFWWNGKRSLSLGNDGFFKRFAGIEVYLI